MNDFRRFVAGAICPNCKKKDTIALSADDKRIFCISCDFEDIKANRYILLLKYNALGLTKKTLLI